MASRQWSGVYGIFGRLTWGTHRSAAKTRSRATRRGEDPACIGARSVNHCGCTLCETVLFLHGPTKPLLPRGCQLSRPHPAVASMDPLCSLFNKTLKSTHTLSAPLFVQLPDRLFGFSGCLIILKLQPAWFVRTCSGPAAANAPLTCPFLSDTEEAGSPAAGPESSEPSRSVLSQCHHHDTTLRQKPTVPPSLSSQDAAAAGFIPTSGSWLPLSCPRGARNVASRSFASSDRSQHCQRSRP